MERNRILDISKGICLMCMILGHTFAWWNNAYPQFNMFVGPFFLVFFFIASGMCFKVKDKKQYIKKRFNRLLVPYIFFCICYALFLIFVRNKFMGMSISKSAKMIFTSSIVALPAEFCDINFFHVDTYGVGPIWFLNCIFLTNMMYLLIAKNKYRLWIWTIIAFLAAFSQKYILLPFNIQDACIGCMFMAIGDKGRIYYEKGTNWFLSQKIGVNILAILPTILIYVIVITKLPYQWMNLGGNVYYIFSLLSTFIGTLMMTIFAVIIAQSRILDEFVEEYGKESMAILMIHGIDILMLRNWAMRDWAFVASTILGYAFCVYLKKRIEALIKQYRI